MSDLMPKNVCLVIDLEGFFIHEEYKGVETSRFLVRELGWCSVGGKGRRCGVKHFRPDVSYHTLHSRDKVTCWYSTNVHGFSFYCQEAVETGCYSQDRLPSLVKELYDTLKRDRDDRVAYKGGHMERDLLNNLSIPCVNLEAFGCPKAKDLPKMLVSDCTAHVSFSPTFCLKVWYEDKLATVTIRTKEPSKNPLALSRTWYERCMVGEGEDSLPDRPSINHYDTIF